VGQPRREAAEPERKQPTALNILFRVSGPPSSADSGIHAAFSSYLVGADSANLWFVPQSPVFCGLPQKMCPNKKLSKLGKTAVFRCPGWAAAEYCLRCKIHQKIVSAPKRISLDINYPL
jgi:hypothetical protein